MTLRDALTEASATIARRDAVTMLAHLLERDRAWLLAHPEEELTAAQLRALVAMTERRAEREPLQYITGVQEFFGLSLRITPATLIPRPETEHLVEAVLAWAAAQLSESPKLKVLDVGTGSGAIAIALAKSLPDAEIVACDVSTAALAVARGNAERLGARVRFVESDLLAAFAEYPLFDVIAANPPYVPDLDGALLQAEVRDHEPHIALFGGADGLDLYRRLIPQAQAALRAGGLLAMELGFGQSEPLAALLGGWKDVRFVEDYAGIPRIVLAERGDA
jgi:release factor glutamine methyltransferase